MITKLRNGIAKIKSVITSSQQIFQSKFIPKSRLVTHPRLIHRVQLQQMAYIHDTNELNANIA